MRRIHLVLACPITNTIKGWRFEVILSESMQTSGVVLTDQIRVLDWQARKAKFIERAEASVVDKALAKIFPLVN